MKEKSRRKVTYIPVNVKLLDYCTRREACPNCGRINTRHTKRKRSVADIHLDAPTVVVFHYATFICRNPDCKLHYQSDTPVVRKGGRYTERAKASVVASVQEDKVTIRTARARAQRDFNISPANATISRWSRVEGFSLLMKGSVQEPVLKEFSGILCVDETYDKKLALLVAVDPVHGKTIAYKVTNSKVDEKAVRRFLSRLKKAGLYVHTVVTDGSPLYPKNLKNVFGPQIRHQLCLFHLSANILRDLNRAMRNAVYKKEKTVHERREVLKKLTVLCRNPSNLLKRAGKSEASKRKWKKRYEELLKTVEHVLEEHSYLKVYAEFLSAYYSIWDAETEEETWKRRDDLLNDPRFLKHPRLKTAMRRLEDDEVFKQYLYCFKDPLIPRTNNAVEGVNRSYRQEQKRHYRGLKYERERDIDMVIRLYQLEEKIA